MSWDTAPPANRGRTGGSMVSGRGYDPVDIVHKQKSRVHAACKKWVQAACKKWFQAACKKCLTKKIYSSKITFQ
jgi:hypothetical protein